MLLERVWRRPPSVSGHDIATKEARTLKNLEVLKILVFGVDVELDAGHGHIDCHGRSASTRDTNRGKGAPTEDAVEDLAVGSTGKLG